MMSKTEFYQNAKNLKDEILDLEDDIKVFIELGNELRERIGSNKNFEHLSSYANGGYVTDVLGVRKEAEVLDINYEEFDSAFKSLYYVRSALEQLTSERSDVTGSFGTLKELDTNTLQYPENKALEEDIPTAKKLRALYRETKKSIKDSIESGELCRYPFDDDNLRISAMVGFTYERVDSKHKNNLTSADNTRLGATKPINEVTDDDIHYVINYAIKHKLHKVYLNLRKAEGRGRGAASYVLRHEEARVLIWENPDELIQSKALLYKDL